MHRPPRYHHSDRFDAEPNLLTPRGGGGVTPSPSVASYAGLHLAGANTQKTTLVVLSGEPLVGSLRVVKLYEKIGAMGTLFSDERLVEILTRSGPFAQVFVDCPLSLPPCVACVRPQCPGAVHCDDVGVAYMLALTARHRVRGARKNRPVNPQSQRLWDVLRWSKDDVRREPSYSANHAPLVARALTLQRRLNAFEPRITLRETLIADALVASADACGVGAGELSLYRDFEAGAVIRRKIVHGLVAAGWLAKPQDAQAQELIAACPQSVETFHAFVAAWVAALYDCGLADRPANGMDLEHGWVHLPVLAQGLLAEA